MRPLVIIESPYAGSVALNVDYARSCCRDSYERGEQPFASHLFYPQFLDDQRNNERNDGITFGYNFWKGAHKIAFYTDEGWSRGMIAALKLALQLRPNAPQICARSLFGHMRLPEKNDATAFLYSATRDGFEFAST